MATEYAKSIDSLSNLELVGIFSRNRNSSSKIAQEHGVTILAESVLDLYEKTKADAVVVCVPELAAESVLKDCSDFPWVVLAEKPLGINLEQAIRISKQFGENLGFVAMNRRFYSSTLAMQHQLNNLSGPRFINITDQENQLAAREFGQPEEVVERWMYANSVHLIDLIPVLARGNLVEFSTSVVNLTSNSHIRMASLSFDSKDVVFYQAYWNTPAKWAVEVTCEQMFLQLKPIENFRTLTLDERNFREFEVHADDLHAKPGLIKMLGELENQISHGRSTLTSMNDAVESIRLIAKIYEH